MSTGPAQATMFGHRDVGGTGDKHQRHFTPYKLALLILTVLAKQLGRAPDVFVEPSCGDGSYLLAARKLWPNAILIGCDIDEHAKGLRLCDIPLHGDWPTVSAQLQATLRILDMFVVVGGNPPFKAANDAEAAVVIEHIQAAIKIGAYASLILPLSLLGGSPRWAPVMSGDAGPPEAWALTPRAWKETRETPAFLWRPRRPEDLPGCRVVQLPRWK